MGDRFHGMARRAEGSGLNRGVRCGVLSLAAHRATRATTELTVAGGTEGSNPGPSSGESVVIEGENGLEI